jgi:hypothetical protein
MDNFDLKKYIAENKLNINEDYSDEKISQIGREYKAFQKMLKTINYDDFIEYAEKSLEFKTEEILEYLKKKTKFI